MKVSRSEMSSILISSRDIRPIISFLLLYNEDILVAHSNMYEIRNLKIQLPKEFDMKD